MTPISTALRRVAAARQIVFLLVALNIGSALLFTAPLQASLKPYMDEFPAARRMLEKPDDGLGIELVMDHPHILSLIASGAMVALILYAFLTWIAAGGLAGVFSTTDSPDGRSFLRTAIDRAGASIQIGLIGLVMRLVPAALSFGAWMLLKRWGMKHGFPAVVASGVLALSVFLIPSAFCSVVLDYARTFFRNGEGTRVRDCLRQAILIGWRKRSCTLRIALFSLGSFLAVTAAYQVVSWRIPVTPAAGFLALLVLRVLAATGRAFFTATTVVAATEVARASDLRSA